MNKNEITVKETPRQENEGKFQKRLVQAVMLWTRTPFLYVVCKFNSKVSVAIERRHLILLSGLWNGKKQNSC